MHENLSKGPEDENAAAKILGVIARDLPASLGLGHGAPVQDYVDQLHDTVVHMDANLFRQTVNDMRRQNVPAASLAEIYVPLVARRIGDGWVADTLDFKSVSIGSARLQALLWQLGPEWAQTGALDAGDGASVLVAVPQGCQHTLGATVLAGQLRYRGISTQLELELTLDGLDALATTTKYTAIFLSASSREPVEALADLVQRARHVYPATPILIGGNVTDQMADIQSRTGADLVTSDLDEALAFCGLGMSSETVAPTRQAG